MSTPSLQAPPLVKHVGVPDGALCVVSFRGMGILHVLLTRRPCAQSLPSVGMTRLRRSEMACADGNEAR
jgi:hypothetical protein